MIIPWIWLLLGLFVFSSALAPDLCKSKICSCTNTSIICRCQKGIGLDELNIFKLSGNNFDVLEVTNCKTVSLWFNCFSEMSFQFMTFKNIQKFQIDSLAFLEIANVDRLLIQNVASFSPKKFGMVMFRKAGTIILKNVTAENLPMEMMATKEMKQLEIIDCDLRMVEPTAFQFKTLERLYVTGTTFRALTTMAFKIEQFIDEITFENSTILYTESNSFSFYNVGTLSIVNCKFDELHSKFIKAQVQVFNFIRNALAMTESNAFSYLNVSNYTTFKMNRFKLVEPNALPDFKRLHGVVAVTGNEFQCDCDLSWLLYRRDDAILQSNYCSDRNKSRLVNYVPKINNQGACIEIVNAIDSENSHEFSPRSMESSSEFNDLWFIFVAVVFVAMALAVFFIVRKYKCQVVCRKTRSAPL